jgi:hypothetical protein
MTAPKRRRSIAELGEIIGWNAVPIAWTALRRVPAIVGVTATDRGSALEELFDCYRRSLVAGKPSGAKRWAERYSAQLGAQGVVEMVAAVGDAVLRVAERHEVDRRRLDTLIERLETQIVGSYISRPPLTLNAAPVI